MFDKYYAAGNWVAHWGIRGSGECQSFCCWGVGVAPPEPLEEPTMITTDWFCDRLQEWTLDGRWIRTIQNHLRSDAQSLRCKNKDTEDQTLYQRVSLQPGTYTVQFLAFTDGNKVTVNDVKPYAPGNPSGTYEDYVLTTVKSAPERYMWACRVSGTFTVGASGSYDIGARVKSGKTVYIASLTCFRN